MNPPLVFTPELVGRAGQKHSSPLLHRWATRDTEQGAALREQIERAANLVPLEKQRRVLGPLQGKSASDDQARSAVGVLLLAKTFSDLGWSVSHEPETHDGTPDLLINKGGVTHLVEVHRIVELSDARREKAYALLHDALKGVATKTPIRVVAAEVNGRASLKPFVRHLKNLFDGPLPTERQVFNQGGVLVVFEVFPAMTKPVPVIGSWSMGVKHGSNLDAVKAAVNLKLSKYKVPLIVALDLFDSVTTFETIEEAILGQTAYEVPVDLGNGVPEGVQPRITRSADGLVLLPGRDGERVRGRLLALLPFSVGGGGPLALRARLLANPALKPAASFEEFAPIPRLVVTSETVDGAEMHYLGADGARLGEHFDWRHVP